MIALATLILYIWVAPAHIVYGDNAEFSGLGALGGVAHPSGYPLYILWLRAWSWLPAQSPAHAAAIATSFLMVLQVVVLHAACRAWGARPLAATAAVALYAAGPIVMRIDTEAEAFAMNGLVVATVLWLAAIAGPLRGIKRVLALGLVAGLGMSNHLSCVLVAPVGVLGVMRGIREREGGWVVGVGLALGGMVIGLLPYLYLFVAPESWMSWRRIETARDLVRHFLRESYGGPGAFALAGQQVHASDSLLALFATIGRSYLWLPAAIAVAALGIFTAVRERAETRVAWATLLASWLIAGPVLVCRFNVEPAGIGLYIVQRFHLVAVLVLVVPLAVALTRLAARMERRLSHGLRSATALHAALSVVGFLAIAAPSLPYVARMHSPAIETALRNMLRTLPPNAVVIGAPDEFHFGLGYLQGVLGERRDVWVITTPMMGMTYYRQRLEQRTGITINLQPGDKLSVSLAAQALATGRPVFIDPFQANIAAAYPTYPYGLLFRVLPAGSAPPPIPEVFAINKELYGRYTFGYATPGRDDQLAAQFHVFYARAWQLLVPALEQAGLRDERAFALAMITTLLPRAP